MMDGPDCAPVPSRVVLISPLAHYAGHHWRATHALANALAAKGVEVEAIVATAPAGGGQIPGPIHYSLPPWWHSFANRLTLHGRRQKVLRIFNNLETLACVLRALPRAMSSQGGVIHLLGGTHIFVFLFALCSRRPVFLSIYGDFLPPKSPHPSFKERLRHNLLRRLLHAHKLILICETDSLRDRWQWLFGEDIHTIPYAITVPSAPLGKDSARAALGLPTDVPILLLFGTQREGKDYGVVLRAAALLQSPVHLLFVGKTISQNNPRRLAEELGFEHATFIERFVDDSEVPQFFFASDAVVLPYEEGFDRGSGVILDACAYGRPIIASRTGYLKWFVETHQVGFLYRPGDASELAAAIRELLALDRAGRAALEERVARTAQLHNWSEVVGAYLQVYGQHCR
jgi:glycosyltransferase involved in cell wall biosynthesis